MEEIQKETNKNYAELQYRYVKGDMTVTEAYIYAYILRWNKTSGKAVSYTNGKIGEELGLTQRVVKNALVGLRKNGFVDQIGRYPRKLRAIGFDAV